MRRTTVTGSRRGHPVTARRPPEDPYVQDAYARDPYEAQDPAAQDPVAEALHDRAAHPPPPPGTLPTRRRSTSSREPPPNAPDPQRWAPTPAPEPEGPSRRLPYGDDPATIQYTGVDDLVSSSAEDERQGRQRRDSEDAFAHLFRDQAGRRAKADRCAAAAPLPAAPPQPRSESTPQQPPAPFAYGPDSTRQPLPEEQPVGPGHRPGLRGSARGACGSHGAAS